MAIGGGLKLQEKEAESDDSNMMKIQRTKRRAFDFMKYIFAFIFSDLGVMVLAIAVAYFGALMYISIELPDEEERYEAKKYVARELNKTAHFLADSFWLHIKREDPSKRFDEKQFLARAEDDLHRYIAAITTAVNDNSYDGQVEGWEYDWTIPNTLLFTLSIMTTIGYGNITPKTTFGQMVTIPYTLFGFPLLTMFLGMGSRKSRKLIDEVVGEEEYMPTNRLEIPIILLMTTIIVFLIFGSMLFTQWEGWTKLDAAYFCFITATTIGFGDMTPTNSFLAYESSFYGKVQMVICVAYCSMGLSFIAMVMSLIQENLMLKAERIKKKVGMGGKQDIRVEEVQRKDRMERDSSGFFIIPVDDDIVETQRTFEEDDVEVEHDENNEEPAEVEDLENEEGEGEENVEEGEEEEGEEGEEEEGEEKEEGEEDGEEEEENEEEGTEDEEEEEEEGEEEEEE